MARDLEKGAMQLVAARKPERGDRVGAPTDLRTFYCRWGKRVFDVVAAAVGLVLASPLLLICAVAVRVDSSGPILFRQCRAGQGGRPFDIIKFRTMVPQAEKDGLRITADGDLRITATGKWLRKLKLDELPQLLNVLMGEMSLVGPRGEVAEYVAVYDTDQLRVLEVKPGITGPAALIFINEEEILAGQLDKEAFYIHTLMPQKLKLDLSYCQRVTFLYDLRLILSTLQKLFGSRCMRSNTAAISPDTILLDK